MKDTNLRIDRRKDGIRQAERNHAAAKGLKTTIKAAEPIPEIAKRKTLKEQLLERIGYSSDTKA